MKDRVMENYHPSSAADHSLRGQDSLPGKRDCTGRKHSYRGNQVRVNVQILRQGDQNI